MSLTSRQSTYRPATAGRNFGHELLSGAGEDNARVLSPAPMSAAVEITRLQNMLRVKEKVVEEQMREIATLKTSLVVKDRVLRLKEEEAEGAKEKATQAQGGAASNVKELSTIKADKRKLESQVNELMRENQKLKDKIGSMGKQNPGIGAQMADLTSQIRSLKLDNDKMSDHCKGLDNVIRGKDKEITRQQKKVEEADAVMKRLGELDNVVRETQKLLEEARAENKTLTQVNRAREADIARLTRELEATRETLRCTQGTLGDANANLKAVQSRAADLETEVALQRDELARTSAVAARVAASEVKAGNKGEGTVPVTQHIEEIKYLSGEISRLRDKVAALEKQLAVADTLKDKFKAAAAAATAAAASPAAGRTPNSSRRTTWGTVSGDVSARRATFGASSPSVKSLLLTGGKQQQHRRQSAAGSVVSMEDDTGVAVKDVNV